MSGSPDETRVLEDGVADAEGPIADAELHALMLQARRTNDAPLHRLVIGYLTLRRVTAEVVTLVAAREGGASVASTPTLRRARQLALPAAHRVGGTEGAS